MTSLSGLTAIVTGAAGAMGEQEARKLAERGANVVLQVGKRKFARVSLD